MLNCEVLLEKLNENPDIEPWFKENLARIIPKGFKKVANFVGEKRVQEMINKTAWIVKNSTMNFDDLNVDENTDEKVRTFTRGSWNEGFIEIDGKQIFSGAKKRKDGTPNFVGELKIDKNVDNNDKIKVLIHEFFGHLIVQGIEPKQIEDKRYAIDGFYIDEISEEGEKIQTRNKLMGEGFAELVSQAVALECGIPYTVSPLYETSYRAARMLCQATKNQALIHNFNGTPYLLEKDMDESTEKGSWNWLGNLLYFDYISMTDQSQDSDNSALEREAFSVQDFVLSPYFVKKMDVSGLSLENLCDEILSFENMSLLKDYKLDSRHQEELLLNNVRAKLGNDYSETEIKKHVFVCEKILDIVHQCEQTSLDKMLLPINSGSINDESRKACFKQLEEIKKQKISACNSSVVFSEDTPVGVLFESFIFLESENKTEITFLDSDNKDIYFGDRINLEELKDLSSNENLDETEKDIKHKLHEQYPEYSGIPESYVYRQPSWGAVPFYVITKPEQDKYDVYIVDNKNKNSLRKLNLSKPQKVGENARKRDRCPDSQDSNKKQIRPKSPRDFISQEAVYCK